MFIDPNTPNEASKLSDAGKATASLLAEVLAASPRLMTLKTMGKTWRLDRLLACESWTEAAIELIALDAPDWSVRRLCLDDHEWLCTLTRFADLPDWLDDTAEGRHPVLALAILSAFLDARARRASTPPAVLPQSAGVSADDANYR